MHDAIRTRLREQDWRTLEQTVARLWERRGWETSLTGHNDGGVDVIARQQTPYRRKAYIQVKAGDQTVGVGAVREYSAHLHHNDIDESIIVTPGTFSAPAVDAAHDLNVKRLNGDAFADLISHANALDLVDLSPAADAAADAEPPTPTHTPGVTIPPESPAARVAEQLPAHPATADAPAADVLADAYDDHMVVVADSATDTSPFDLFLDLRAVTANTTVTLCQFSGGVYNLCRLTPTRRDRLTRLLDETELTCITSDVAESPVVTVTAHPDQKPTKLSGKPVARTERLLATVYDRSLDDISVVQQAPPAWGRD